MKLNYDRKSKNPTYFIQKGYRNGKKTTTKNIVRIGKHMEVTIDFAEKLKAVEDLVSASTNRNIGYFFPSEVVSQIGTRFKTWHL